MNAAAWKRLIGSVVPASERWAFRGKLAYRQPMSHILTGVLAEGSGFGGRTYIWRVTMPLFVPNETVVLSWSERMGGGANRFEDDDQDALRMAVSRAIANVADQESQLGGIVSAARGSRNLHAAEVAAYALVLLGEPSQARTLLAAARQSIDGPQWVHDVVERMLAVDHLLGRGATKEATALLARWELATVAALRLDDGAG